MRMWLSELRKDELKGEVKCVYVCGCLLCKSKKSVNIKNKTNNKPQTTGGVSFFYSFLVSTYVYVFFILHIFLEEYWSLEE